MRLIGVTSLEPPSATYAVLPSGVIEIHWGEPPKAMAVRGVLEARLIGVTLFEPVLATYAVLPSGVIAIE